MFICVDIIVVAQVSSTLKIFNGDQNNHNLILLLFVFDWQDVNYIIFGTTVLVQYGAPFVLFAPNKIQISIHILIEELFQTNLPTTIMFHFTMLVMCRHLPIESRLE